MIAARADAHRRGGHRRRQREDRAAGRGAPAARASSGTSAGTRWPAASGPARWPPARRCSTAGPGRSRRTRRSDPGRGRAGRGARRAVRRRTGAAEPGGARPGGRPDLARAAPARRAGRRAARRRARRAPRAVRARASATSPGWPAGDPVLYGQIVAANADAVLALLAEVRDRLDAVIAAVGDGDRAALEALLAEGVAGTRAIPGKHGGPVRPDRARSSSRCPTTPASWPGCSPTPARASVNIEDVRIDHDPGRPVGLVELRRRGGPRRAPAGLSGSPGLGDPPVGSRLVSSAVHASERGRRRRRRHLGIGEVEHLARGRRPARAALPRHRRDVPRDDLVDAPRRASTSTTRRPSPRACDEPRIVSGTDPLGPTITVDGEDVARRDPRGRRQRRGVRR